MLKDIKNSTKTAYRPIYNDFAIPAKNILDIISEIEDFAELGKQEPWLGRRAKKLKEALGFKYEKEAIGEEELAAWEIFLILRNEKRFLGYIPRRI